MFLREEHRTEAERETLVSGARALGAAFQNINFLRDLAEDTDELGRDYLGGGEGLAYPGAPSASARDIAGRLPNQAAAVARSVCRGTPRPSGGAA